LPGGASYYPYGDGDSGYGWLGFIKKNNAETDGSYLVVVTACRRIGNAGSIIAVPVSATGGVLVAGGERDIQNAPTGSLRVGSPLIAVTTSDGNRSAGAFATIIEVNADGSGGKLDHMIDPFDSVTEAYVIAQDNKPRLSPALATASSRVYLRP
jgi:hypothetical protein